MTETQDDPLVNVEAEQAVLGCLLVAPVKSPDQKQSGRTWGATPAPGLTAAT